jgi:hypothetical protein
MLIRFTVQNLPPHLCGEIEAKERQIDDNSKWVPKP